jgi:hypothetical protein
MKYCFTKSQRSNMSISPNTFLSRNLEIITNEIDDEILMMSIEDGKYYGLNPVGSEIWKLIEEPKTLEEVIPALMEIFEIDEDSCRKESLEFIESMIKNNIILAEASP